MFDTKYATADDASVIAEIVEEARAEAAAGARRLAAIAELAHRRVTDDDDERALHAFDGWDSAAAEVAAAMAVGHRRASGQMRIAIALRDRFPKVAALFWTGNLSTRLVSTITWRTQLVEDAEALALIDTAIAERATNWGPLSEHKLDQAIDFWVEKYDPAALWHTESATRSCDFTVGDIDDPAGVTSVWGRLRATDAAVVNRRVTEMAHGVCDQDPRSMGERRAAALGVLAEGNDHLVCTCGSESCPSAGERPSTRVVVHVLAEQSAVDTASAPEANTAAPAEPRKASPALILGGGVLPTPLLAELIRGGAKVRPITPPCDEPEPHYRPSTKLAEFVRMRDLFCRAPGCDVPADKCDIDHTNPYPFGPTHASNLKCLCRKGHLGKTFDGWGDVQLPDGTVIWTSPSGQSYITTPGSRLFFPHWNTTTAELPPSVVVPTDADRGLMMPRRRRTRAAQQAVRIATKRAHNQKAPPY